MRKKNWRARGRSWLSVGGAVALALQTTLSFSVPAAAKTADATYVYPKTLTTHNEVDGTDTVWYDIDKGDASNRITTAGSNTRDEEEIIRRALNYKPSGSSDSLLQKWAKVAYNVIGSHPYNYWDDNANNYNSDYRGKFGPTKETFFNLAEVFAYDGEEVLEENASKHLQGDGYMYLGDASKGKKTSKSKRSSDCAWISGLQFGNSLTDVKNVLYDGVSYKTGTKGVNREYIQAYSEIPLLNEDDDAKEQPVAYSIACATDAGLANQFTYYGYGLVFYDFEMVPINNDDEEKDAYNGFIFSEEMKEATVGKNIEEEGEGNVSVSVPGFSYDRDYDNTTATVYNNTSDQEESYSETFTDSHTVTYSNNLTNTTTNTQQLSFSRTRTMADAGLFFKDVTKTTTFGGNFSSAYAEAESKGKSDGTTESNSHTESGKIPPHSAKVVTTQHDNEQCVIDYRQAVAVYYKTAMIAITGHYYVDGAAINNYGGVYGQDQFCTIFGAVDSKLKENTAYVNDDAITCLQKRYDARNKNSKQGIESSFYTWVMHRKGSSQKIEKSPSKTPVATSLDWQFIQNHSEDYPIDQLVSSLATDYHVMNAAGAKMQEVIETVKFEVSDAVPNEALKDMRIYQNYGAAQQMNVGRITLGADNTLKLSNYQVKARFDGGVVAASFDAANAEGTWVLMDANEKEIAFDSNGVAQNDIAQLSKDSSGDWQIKPLKAGKINLKYRIGHYEYYDMSKKKIVNQLEGDKTVNSNVIQVVISDGDAVPQAYTASMTTGSSTGVIAVIIVIVLVIAGAVFVAMKKKRTEVKE